MVNYQIARTDSDRYLLPKIITYRKITETITNLAYNSIDRSSYIDYLIYAQVTVTSDNFDYKKEGKNQTGELVGWLRYEYTETSSGVTIVPALVPAQGDMIVFNNNKYSIKSCTPATSETNEIIGWDIIAGRI